MRERGAAYVSRVSMGEILGHSDEAQTVVKQEKERMARADRFAKRQRRDGGPATATSPQHAAGNFDATARNEKKRGRKN